MREYKCTAIAAAAQYGQQTAVHSTAVDSRPTCRLASHRVSSAVTFIVVQCSCRCSEVVSGSGSCMAGRTALVVGGTGEVGKQVLAALAASPEYSRVVSLGRRQTDLPTLPGYDKVLSNGPLQYLSKSYVSGRLPRLNRRLWTMRSWMRARASLPLWTPPSAAWAPPGPRPARRVS